MSIHIIKKISDAIYKEEKNIKFLTMVEPYSPYKSYPLIRDSFELVERLYSKNFLEFISTTLIQIDIVVDNVNFSVLEIDKNSVDSIIKKLNENVDNYEKFVLRQLSDKFKSGTIETTSHEEKTAYKNSRSLITFLEQKHSYTSLILHVNKV